MKKFLVILPLIFLAGCEYRYRYECQDPANWGKESCNNDVCKADGDCATDLLGFTPKVAEQFRSIDGFTPSASMDKFVPGGNQGISNKTGTDCKTSEKPKFKPFNATVQQNTRTFKNSQQDNLNPMDSIKRPKAEEMVGQVEQIERPLTMDTMVETANHNNAAKFNKW